MQNVVKATVHVVALKERPPHFCPENEDSWFSK
jgi:hypothetical protein